MGKHSLSGRARRASAACGVFGLVVGVLGGALALVPGATASTVNTVIATIPVGGAPDVVAVDPTTNTIYVTNANFDTVSVIDGATNTVTATIGVGYEPTGIAIDPATNTVYVANYGSGTVSVINGATNAITATIPVGGNPYGVAVDPTTDTIYVANEGSDAVSVINGATNAVTATIPVGTYPHGVAVDPTTNTIYVANEGSYPGTISVIDGATNAVTATIPAGNGPEFVAVDPSTDTIYVTDYYSGKIAAIDGATNAVTATIPGGYPSCIAADPSTDTVYAANFDSDTVSVIDEATNTVTSTIPVGSGPYGIAVDPSTDMVYAANWDSSSVSVIDGGGGAGSLPPTSPTTTTLSGGASITLPATGSFTATVTVPSGPPAGAVTFTATGGGTTVTLCSDVAVAASGALGTQASATCDPPSGTWPGAGSYSVVASFVGATGYGPSSSSPLAVTVSDATGTTQPPGGTGGSPAPSTTTTLVGPSGEIHLPSTGTFTSTTTESSSPVSSGTVGFVATGGGNTVTLCSDVPVSSAGVATCDPASGTWPNATAVYSVVATYDGSPTYGPSTSSPAQAIVLKAPITTGTSPTQVTLTSSTTTLTAPPGAIQLPATGSFSSTTTESSSPVGSGTVTFTATGGGSTITLCSAVPVSSSGVATCDPASGTWPSAGGSYTVVAAYSGTSAYAASTSSPGDVTVDPVVVVVTTTGLSAPLTPIELPATGSFTSTTTSGSGPVSSGTVSFTATGGGGTVTLCSDVPVSSSGVATCAPAAGIWSSGGGSYTVTAYYSGPAPYESSTSSPQSVSVEPVVAPPTSSPPPVSAGNSPSPTTTSVSVGPSAPLAGKKLELVAKVASSAGAVGGGTVQFSIGHGTGTVAVVVCGTAQVVDGAATCTTTLGAGTYSVVASYSGSASYGSSSGSSSVVVAKASSTSVLLTSPSPAAAGELVTLSASAVDSSGPVTSGTIEITTPSGAVICPATTVDSSGKITCRPGTAFVVGQTPVVAHYSGSSDVASSTASSNVVVVKDPSTTTVSASPSSTVHGGAVEVTALVTSELGIVDSGTVTITGPGGEICAVTVGSGGLAHCETSSLGVGTDQITASYAGTATIAGSKGATTVTVEGQTTGPSTGPSTGGGSNSTGGNNTGAGGGSTHHKGSPHRVTTHKVPSHPIPSHPTVPVVSVPVTPVAAPPVVVTVPVHPRVLATTTQLRARRIGQDATLLSSRTFAAGVAVSSGTVSFIGPGHKVLCSGVAVSAGGHATCRTYLLPRQGATVLAVYAPSTTYDGSRSVARVPALPALHPRHVPAPVTAVGHPKPVVSPSVTSCPTAVAPKGATKWAVTYLAKDVFFWLILVMLGLFAFWQRLRGRRGEDGSDDNDAAAATAEALYAKEGE